MIFIIATVFIAALVYGPTLWVRWVMKSHNQRIEGMPGTGAELARHLLDRFELNEYKVEQTEAGQDHFDPSSNTVRLSPDNYNQKSLTAVAVAAHEVGHAIQFHRQERVSQLRQRYVPAAIWLKKIGVASISVLPFTLFLGSFSRINFIIIGFGLLMQLLGALLYLVVLPEEWDASFDKALPILEQGEYLAPDEYPAVRRILKAAALTYFAGALADMLNIGRWWWILRR